MARILISAIGTGPVNGRNEFSRDYRTTVYKFPGSLKEYKTSFVASALCEYLKVDRLYLVGTPKSMWEEVYSYYSDAAGLEKNIEYWNELGDKAESFDLNNDTGRITEENLEILNATIDKYLKSINSSASGGSKCFIIDYGLNETELWNNFNTFIRISDKLQEDDEVYLDITHAFRSIALFNYITLDLIGILKFKKAFKLSGLFYGMLDVYRELGYAPIIDLSPYYNITSWARGAYNFINFGNGYLLSELIADPDLSNSIKNISEIVNINYIDDFKKNIDYLNSLVENNLNCEPVINYMKHYLSAFTRRFKGINSSGKLQLALSEWYFENKRYAQGYICLVESIISKFLESYREKDSTIKWNEENRNKVKYLIVNHLQYEEKYCKIYEEYETIRKIRNTVAHAGYTRNKNFVKDIEEALSHLNNVKKYVFNSPDTVKEITEKFPFNTLNTNERYKQNLDLE